MPTRTFIPSANQLEPTFLRISILSNFFMPTLHPRKLLFDAGAPPPQRQLQRPWDRDTRDSILPSALPSRGESGKSLVHRMHCRTTARDASSAAARETSG